MVRLYRLLRIVTTLSFVPMIRNVHVLRLLSIVGVVFILTKNDANDDIVKELLDAEDEWIGEYVASDDYGNGYAYLVSERSYYWSDRIGEWLDDNCTDGGGWKARPRYTGELRKALVEGIADRMDECDYEAHYQSNEYANWGGDGCCLDSLEVGEYETQIDIAGRPEFEALAASGDLEGCLDRYNGDLYISCNDRYDAESGRRVRTGYVSHGCFWGYSTGWGRWHYVVSDERMNALLCESIVDYCERADGGKFGA